MKKLLLIIVVFIFTISLFAQDAKKTDFRIGLKAAPSISWMKPDNKSFENSGSKLNFSYGLVAEYYFAPNYGISSGLEVMNTGGELKFPVAPEKAYYVPDPSSDTTRYNLISRNYTLKYLNIPVTLKFKTNEIGYLTYYGQFGIDLGFKRDATSTDEGTYGVSTDISKKEDVDLQKDVQFMRMALNIGLGVEYGLTGNTSLLIGLNYNNGFTNALKKESNFVFDHKGQQLKQAAFANYVALTIGIMF